MGRPAPVGRYDAHFERIVSAVQTGQEFAGNSQKVWEGLGTNLKLCGNLEASGEICQRLRTGSEAGGGQEAHRPLLPSSLPNNPPVAYPPARSRPTDHSPPTSLLHINEILQRPRTRNSGQITPWVTLPTHLKEMLPNRRNLGIILLRIHRIPILQLIPIRMVHEPGTIGHIVHEETPEQVPRDDGFRLLLRRLDDCIEL